MREAPDPDNENLGTPDIQTTRLRNALPPLLISVHRLLDIILKQPLLALLF